MADRVQEPHGLVMPYESGSRRSGWLTFAAVMFIAAAAFNAIYGVSALVNDDYFRADELLFGDLSMSIGAYPVWTVIVLVIDGLIIYGLTVHGFDEVED